MDDTNVSVSASWHRRFAAAGFCDVLLLSTAHAFHAAQAPVASYTRSER